LLHVRKRKTGNYYYNVAESIENHLRTESNSSLVGGLVDNGFERSVFRFFDKKTNEMLEDVMLENKLTATRMRIVKDFERFFGDFVVKLNAYIYNKKLERETKKKTRSYHKNKSQT